VITGNRRQRTALTSSIEAPHRTLEALRLACLGDITRVDDMDFECVVLLERGDDRRDLGEQLRPQQGLCRAGSMLAEDGVPHRSYKGPAHPGKAAAASQLKVLLDVFVSQREMSVTDMH
jgi:hypothetical protein